MKPVKKFWENDQRPNIYLLWGPKIGPLRPIFHIPLKVLAMSMLSNTDVKSVKTFREVEKSRIWLTSGVRNGLKLDVEAHIVHISESTSNEHLKQNWCEPEGTFLQNSRKPEFLLICRPKNLGRWGPIFYTTKQKSSCNEHVNKVCSESNGNKIDENFYIDLFWPYLGPKMAWKFSPQYACKQNFKVSY